MRTERAAVEYFSKLPSPFPPSFILRPPVFSYCPCLEWSHLIANMSPLLLFDFHWLPFLGSKTLVLPVTNGVLYIIEKCHTVPTLLGETSEKKPHLSTTFVYTCARQCGMGLRRCLRTVSFTLKTRRQEE